MNRRQLLTTLLGAGALGALAVPLRAVSEANGTTDFGREDWKRILPPERFHILFEAGTERAGSSPLNAEKRDGLYLCAACHQPLFDARTKYDSGTGWPSFWDPLNGAVGRSTDYKLLYPRTEYHCSRCGGHQGHVFKDGPRPTGLRYCNNGLALIFVPEGEALPALRG